jgi:hypothetical protein
MLGMLLLLPPFLKDAAWYAAFSFFKAMPKSPTGFGAFDVAVVFSGEA